MPIGSNLVTLNRMSLCPTHDNSKMVFPSVAGTAIVISIRSAKPFKID